MENDVKVKARAYLRAVSNVLSGVTAVNAQSAPAVERLASEADS